MSGIIFPEYGQNLLLADQGWGVAGSINETLYILRDKNVISLEMMEKMVSMAGFRNILIHEFEEVNLEIFSGSPTYFKN